MFLAVAIIFINRRNLVDCTNVGEGMCDTLYICTIQYQGSYRSWKTWKVMEFDNLDSRPGKSWNFCPGHGKSWNLMLANMYAAVFWIGRNVCGKTH